jgi:unsaturated rhamnogalacturonyl hydrolase
MLARCGETRRVGVLKGHGFSRVDRGLLLLKFLVGFSPRGMGVKELLSNLPSLRLAAGVFLLPYFLCVAIGQSLPTSRQVADAAMARWPAAGFAGASGAQRRGMELLFEALDEEWLGTADAAYFRYIESAVEPLVAADGTIEGYNRESRNLENIALGRELLLLYRVTLRKKYFDAAANLRMHLISQPRRSDGGFWHSKGDPGQMRAEDLEDVEPFNAEFAAVFQQPQSFADITRQFTVFADHAWDARDGLLRGLTEENARPAGEQGAASETDELRSTAVYLTALVDTLPHYPRADGGRATLLAILRREADAVVHSANLGGPRPAGVDPETSANAAAKCMIAYALAKSVRLGFLPSSYRAKAEGLFQSVQAQSSQAWVGEDPAGDAALILASREMEIAPTAKRAQGARVLLDAWFNSQKRVNALGESEYFHYKWDDESDSGFSLLGHLFRDSGMETDTLYDPPCSSNLRGAQFYMIVSPDIPAKNPAPHSMTDRDAEQIAEWVKGGGILLMMENDPANADIEHFDILADKFGIHFNYVLSHHVIGDTFSMGRIEASGGGELFQRPRILYMKDTCTISLRGSARPLLIDKGDVMMATSKYGKGTVFAAVDPWLYNEYTDGRKLPPDFDNFGGAQDLVRWLAAQSKGEESRKPGHSH